MNGYYIGAMGMMAYQQQLNTHSNNITNSQTNGYKFDSMVSTVFESLNSVRKNDDSGRIGVNNEKIINVNSPINWTEGQYVNTNKMFDIALVEGAENQTTFFVLQGENETLLTRNGQFEINENRELRTSSGEFVLDVNNQKIKIPEGEIGIAENGVLTDEKGNEIAQIQVRTVVGNDRSNLIKSANAQFEYDGNIANLGVGAFEMEQGVVETSNVSMSNQLVELMNTQKKFQASSKVMNIFDNVYDKAANKLL